jgi:hypothetical protein
MSSVRYTHPDELKGTRFARLAKLDLERAAAIPHLTFEEKDPPPRKTCPTCAGTGVSTWTGPDAGSCPTCRGMKRVELDDGDIRTAYREARLLACIHLETTSEAFDAAIGASLPKRAPPVAWLLAAKRVVACISPRSRARKVSRKKDR